MVRKTAIGLAMASITIAGLFFTMAALGVLVSSQTVSNSGVIASVNLGVYTDYACTQSLNSISWGALAPSDSVSRTVYVKNTGNMPLTLSVSVTNWSPSSANGPVGLTWDRQNTVLNANQVLSAVFTLTVSSNTNGVTTFSFNIVVSGTA